MAGRDVTVVWAVTSANHHTTRRNPVPYSRRESAIERFSVQEGLRSLVVGIHDVPPTDDFAEVTVKACREALGLPLTPADTQVACSTASVSALYRGLGYTVLPVEDEPRPEGAPAPELPWEVLTRLAGGDDGWRVPAHPASVDVLTRYRLDEHVRTVLNDPVVGDDGGLTPSRDYHSYAESFEVASDRKWAQVAPYVRPGRILDIGCATGALLERIDADPRFHESDLIGVEVARHLMAECEHKVAQGRFRNPNVFFHQRNMLGDTVFPPRSIDTSISIALTHEIWSYTRPVGARRDQLQRFVDRIAAHTAPGGVWVNADVCGPGEPERPVLLELDDSDGTNPPPRPDLDRWPREQVAEHVAGLSTRARLAQFAVDFERLAGVRVEHQQVGDAVRLRLADAMDYLTRKDYADNWLSECHEQFCGLSWADWQDVVRAAGMTLDAASRPWRNDWVVEHRIAPVAGLRGLDGAELEWPDTHVLLVARPGVTS
ncbi:class I SAM-dependent methyltransferase [Auraticoccus monumenti]|uniref:Methyltransferase domain-containing protein n=1 Tax=Auraticoccus monumenti TaxID=675864 RepID=A0A1G7E119_9ACTN|nr:class I SAM-dependent methyltransferase [Auraticoccus monumenti]SDE57407.1 hypothetical protein SAMN04489747_3787 [Auraticoccus monumenti]